MPQISKALIDKICDSETLPDEILIEGINRFYLDQLINDIKRTADGGDKLFLSSRFATAFNRISNEKESLALHFLPENIVYLIQYIIWANDKRKLTHLFLFDAKNWRYTTFAMADFKLIENTFTPNNTPAQNAVPVVTKKPEPAPLISFTSVSLADLCKVSLTPIIASEPAIPKPELIRDLSTASTESDNSEVGSIIGLTRSTSTTSTESDTNEESRTLPTPSPSPPPLDEILSIVNELGTLRVSIDKTKKEIDDARQYFLSRKKDYENVNRLQSRFFVTILQNKKMPQPTRRLPDGTKFLSIDDQNFDQDAVRAKQDMLDAYELRANALPDCETAVNIARERLKALKANHDQLRKVYSEKSCPQVFFGPVPTPIRVLAQNNGVSLLQLNNEMSNLSL